jgi:hypothetical protein
MVIDMWRPKFLRLPEQIYNEVNELAMIDSGTPTKILAEKSVYSPWLICKFNGHN